MAKNKVFNVHDLYPEDYCFDYESFYADPEGYVFTPDDIAYYNAMELERYEQEVPMTYYEKTLLRKWVRARCLLQGIFASQAPSLMISSMSTVWIRKSVRTCVA